MRFPKFMTVILLAITVFVGDDDLQAAGMDGNTLLSSCQQAIRALVEGDASARTLEAGICLGYASGYRDALDYQKLYSSIEICIPDAATNGQIMRILIKFLEDNPKQLHQSAEMLAFAALKIAYPCSN